MMTKEKNNPQYKIDWVRVYQDPTKDEQKVGCSTPERPTRQYIEAHEDLYKTDQDDHPLKSVQVGLGKCDPTVSGDDVSRASCGGYERGQCTNGKVCECKMGWVGPHCLSSFGSDPIVWDEPDKLTDVGFVPPYFVSKPLLIGLTAVLLSILIAAKLRRHLEGWTPIPDVEMRGKPY